jgi:hypothetical protein
MYEKAKVTILITNKVYGDNSNHFLPFYFIYWCQVTWQKWDTVAK